MPTISNRDAREARIGRVVNLVWPFSPRTPEQAEMRRALVASAIDVRSTDASDHACADLVIAFMQNHRE